MTTATRPARSQAVRRYPALSYLAGAGALALLLPSGLTLPQSGPQTLAELAPVPGQGQGIGDVSELGQAGSGGLGSGGAGGVGGATTTTLATDGSGDGADGGRGVRRPGSKNCVGKPPRQTEDPLSPPCIAFFDGENGGATSRGVTADEVSVVILFGTSTANDPSIGTFTDCTSPIDADDTADDRLCKAYTKFFNSRYQTYKRLVRVWGYTYSSSNLQYDAVLADVIEKRTPFAIVSKSAFNGEGIGLAVRAARNKVLATVYTAAPRDTYQSVAPYLIGVRPDIEDQAELMASYVCTKLAGRPPRYAGGVERTATTRKFAIYGGGENEPSQRAFTEALRARCGIEPRQSNIQAGQTEAGRLQAEGITTNIALGTAGQFILASQMATQTGWFPEWFLPGDKFALSYDTNTSARRYNAAQWDHAFGITYDYRRDRIEEQHWYRAFREGCPDCAEPVDTDDFAVYDTMAMLFYGIQAAGPRLTVENVDRGMHAIRQEGSPDPYRPAAYFAPGNYSFIKDATEIWWDAQGAAPGDAAPGCYRLPREGRRFRAGEWAPGDADIKDAGPCQGSTQRS